MPDKNTPSFHKDKKRRLKCVCDHYFGKVGEEPIYVRLHDNKTREYDCPKCKRHLTVPPPIKGIKPETGEHGTYWGDNNTMFTADPEQNKDTN